MQKKPRDKRYRYVSRHAVERLRERIIALDLDYRLDADLEQWLDDAVEKAIRRGDVQIVTDRNEPAQLVNLEALLEAPAFALVKSNDHPNAKSGMTEAVVTVMDDIMVTKYQQGRWRDDKHRPFQVLAGMKAPPKSDPVVAIKPDPPKPKPDKPDEQMLVSYVGERGVTYEVVPRAKLKHFLIQLALDPEVEQETIRAWREVSVNLKVSVDIEL